MSSNKHIWVVFLAAGEGKRVKSLTTDLWGNSAPMKSPSINGLSDRQKRPSGRGPFFRPVGEAWSPEERQ